MPVLKNIAAIAKGMSITFREMFNPTIVENYPDGKGPLQPLAGFMTNAAGSAIVNTSGPIRQIVQSDAKETRRYLVIAEGTATQTSAVVQVQH